MKYLVTLLFLLFAIQAEAATYWVSPTGNNASCATIAASGPTTTVAKTTIAAGLACMTAGDTLNIRAGTYATSIPQSGWPSGSGTTYSTVQAYNNEAVTITPVGWNFAFYNADSHHILLHGIKFDSGGTGETPVILNGSHHITFESIEVTNAQGNMNVTGDGNIIRNSTFHDLVSPACVPGTRYYGLYISATNDMVVENNTFYNLPGGGIQAYNSGGTPNTNLTIRNNVFHDVPTCSTSNIGGFLISDTSSGQAYNNVIYSTNYATPGIYLFNGASDINLYGNTIYAASGYGIKIEGSVTGTINIKNNILSTNTVGPYFNSSSATIVADHNLCSSACGFGSANVTDTAANTFVSAASADFHLGPNSFALNQGSPLSAPYDVDILAVPRPQGAAYDIGAYESASAAPIPVVTITQPAGCTGTSTACTVTSSTVTLAGTTSVSSGTVSSDAYTCDRCTATSGAANGTPTSWILPTLTLKAGTNIIMVTATGSLGGTGTDTITITYAPTHPGNSLVLAFGFDEGSGTSLTDASGAGNTGTAVAAPTWAGGRYGNALQFNGTNQYIQVLDDNSLDLTQSFTISLWVKPAAVATDFRSLVHKNAGAVGSPYELYASVSGYCGSGGVAGFTTANGTSGPSDRACYATPLPIGTWTHVAVTWDGTNIKLYTQGTLRATQPHTGYAEQGTGTLQIAATEFGEYFQGVIDELRIYNFALPLTGGANTVFGAGCNATDAANVKTASIIGDANCPVIPLAPPITFKVGASTTLKLGASSTMKIGSVPQ